ncbi:hypothetical protein [[Eubacterium] hominis]|uniref:hypothetical protein n=1 Tax=[Eubacterium] hominis TaxID=2764325 RepID=UPI003A4E0DD8
MNRFMKVATASVLAMTMLAGCGGSKDKEGSEDATIKMWTWRGTEELMKMDTKDIMAVQKLSEVTGVKTDWLNPSDPDTEFQMLMTSGENMPDAMFYKYTPQDVVNYAANGNIIDLSPYLDDMPNLKKLLDNNPKLKAQVTSEDGKIYYLPWITEEKYYFEGMMMRKDWLEAVNMEVPTNNEELYQVLKAQKALFDEGKLPNAGDKFYGLGGYPTQLIKLAYGFDTTNEFMIEDGKIIYGPTSNGYRDAMKWFYKLSKEGLIDPDVLSMERDVYMQHHTTNTTSAFVDGYSTFQEVEATTDIEYVPVGYMKNADGKIMEYNSTAKRIAQPYGWAITKTGEKNIEDICKLFDYAYSEEGQTLMSWGIEGDTYEVKDGKKVYTDKIMKDAEYSAGIAVAKYVKPDFGLTDVATQYALIDDRGMKTYDMWANTDVTGAMEPTLWTTDEESTLISEIFTDLKTGAEEYKEKFMTGAADPNDDKVWKEFQSKLESLRVKEITDTYNAAYQRFAERIK